MRHGRIINSAILQGFHKAANGGQRRFQLMGNIGRKVRAHLLQAADFSDILHHGQRAHYPAFIAHGRNIEPQWAMSAAHSSAGGNLVGVHAALAHRFIEHFIELDILGGIVDEAPLGISDDAQ